MRCALLVLRRHEDVPHSTIATQHTVERTCRPPCLRQTQPNMREAKSHQAYTRQFTRNGFAKNCHTTLESILKPHFKHEIQKTELEKRIGTQWSNSNGKFSKIYAIS